MASFNDRINELYEEARDRDYKVGRKRFAEMIGATRGQLNGWLDRGVLPNIEVIKRVARKLDVSILWLIGETEERGYPSFPTAGLLPDAKRDYELFVEFLHYKYRREERRRNRSNP